MTHFLIFGIHPRLSLAEFHALKPRLKPPVLTSNGAMVEDPHWNGEKLMDQLGGAVKLGDIVISLPLDEFSEKTLIQIISNYPRSNSVMFGLTVLGGTKSKRSFVHTIPLKLKKQLRAEGRRCRWVTSGGNEALSPAAVAKTKLTSEGYDFVIFIHGGRAHVGLTTHVQDADAWSVRDYGRPIRNERAGMLPPKLARILVNLGKIKKNDVVLDPFCGNGTILMEAALGSEAKRIIGSDINIKQVASTERNTSWLIDQGILKKSDAERFTIFQSDVRELSQKNTLNPIDAVITEGSLGPPLKGSESKKMIENNRDEIQRLWMVSLRKLHPLLTNDARCVIIWPSFKTKGGIARVAIDDHTLRKMGYATINPLKGWDESGAPLIYHRQGQKVSRRIVILNKTIIH